jgi:hypothetical protein
MKGFGYYSKLLHLSIHSHSMQSVTLLLSLALVCGGQCTLSPRLLPRSCGSWRDMFPRRFSNGEGTPPPPSLCKMCEEANGRVKLSPCAHLICQQCFDMIDIIEDDIEVNGFDCPECVGHVEKFSGLIHRLKQFSEDDEASNMGKDKLTILSGDG